MRSHTSASRRATAPPPARRAAMVRWFDPSQLADTAMKVVVSSLFGSQADRRILDAVAHRNPKPCDHSANRELWIDYIADTGDGFDSTYAVAYYASQKRIAVSDQTGATHRTERGHVLVLGGDQVYPTASRDAYEQRLVAPFQSALAQTVAPHPTVFAVPGNHDWYDSLVAFTRLFCSDGGRWFGGRVTEQALSYFAVKLPHDWWLIGTDMQLESDIDDPQLEYFRALARTMGPRDRIILCLAEPHWIQEARYRKYDPAISQKNLKVLEEQVFERKVSVFLAGDLHHYRRHADDDGRQKITAGGGGAFLYPTHADVDEVSTIADGYKKKSEFPSIEASRKLARRNLIFPFVNPTFGFATAALYLLLGWAVKADLSNVGLTQFGTALSITATAALQSQVAIFWGALLFLGFYFFTDPTSPRYRFWGGSLHGLAHLVAAFFAGWLSTFVTVQSFHLTFGTWQQLLAAGGIIAVLGYVVGAEIMGLYLFISISWFGRQAGEAFSSLHCEHHKSWLRIHITESGDLKLYPIGIDRVPLRWKEGAPDPGPDGGEWAGLLVPDDPRATQPRLIEVPVTVSRPGVPGGSLPGVHSNPTITAA